MTFNPSGFGSRIAGARTGALPAWGPHRSLRSRPSRNAISLDRMRLEWQPVDLPQRIDRHDDLQSPPLTVRTAFNVDPGQARHQGRCRFDRFWRGLGLMQQASAHGIGA